MLRIGWPVALQKAGISLCATAEILLLRVSEAFLIE
jgi:hypothetical protein